MSFLDKLNKPFFVLAPMDDVTDTVFRQIIADCAPPDLYFTEFVNVDGLQSPGRPKLLKKLQFTNQETPIIAQLWGKNPENYYKTAKELVEIGFAGIDINMGCPVKAVVRNGCCSALIDNRQLAGEMIAAVRSAVGKDFPISVKTRLGVKEVDLTWLEFLLNQDLDMLTIHGRTAKEMSKVPANWDLIGLVREMRDNINPKTLIVGNGDVMSREGGEQLAKKYELDGIMIGRGIFHDPFVFSGVGPWKEFSKPQKLELYAKHVQLFAKTRANNERRVHNLNKFCKIYVEGFDGAKELREKLMSAESTEDLLDTLKRQS